MSYFIMSSYNIMTSSLNQFIKTIVLIGLFLAVLGSGYIFFATIVLRKKDFGGFFNSWQFPMLLAIFIDAAFYKHVNVL